MSLLEARLRSLGKTCTRRQRSQLHGLLLTSSLHRLPGLPALLIRRATDIADMAHADLLFSSFLRDLPDDAALYNAMIRGCSYHGPHERALDLFEEMLRRCLATDGFTYPYVLDACARLPTRRRYGEQVHCRVLKEGLDHVQAVGSSLLAFYLPGGGGSLGDARRLYDGMRVKAVGLANHMMSEYAKAGDAGSAREVFDAMTDRDVASWNWMLAMHVKSGDIVAAKELFAAMPLKNVLS